MSAKNYSPSYFICGVMKSHASDCTHIQHHNERQKEEYTSNPDIRKDLSCQNYHLFSPSDSYRNLYRKRLAETGCKERKNSVVLVSVLVTASPEYMQKITQSGNDRLFFETATEFLNLEYGKENVVSAVVHMDEKTPHMHYVYVPVYFEKEKNKYHLHAGKYIGSSALLRSWQSRFYLHMHNTFPELERGIPHVITGSEQIPMPLMKQASEVEEFLRAINITSRELTPFNYKKKCANLHQSFMNNAFFRKFAYVKSVVAQLEKENKDLKSRISEKDNCINKLLDERTSFIISNQNLERKCASIQMHYKSLLSQIPDPIIEQATHHLKEIREKADHSHSRER